MTQISNTMSDPIYDAVMASEEREVPPLAGEQTTKEGRSYTAKPWTLIWWRFRKHKLAVASAVADSYQYVVSSPNRDTARGWSWLFQ